MTSGRRNHAVPVKIGETFGQLTVEAEVEPDPHYGKRARYRCNCGSRVVRVCSLVRLTDRRARIKASRTGRTYLGPICSNQCSLTWGSRR